MYSIVGEMKRVVTVWVRKNLCFSLPTQFFLFISQKCLQILYQCAFRRCSRLMNSTFDGTEAPEPRSLKSRTFKAENLVDVKDFRDSYLLLVIFQSTVSSIIERPSSKFWRTFFPVDQNQIRIKRKQKLFMEKKSTHENAIDATASIVQLKLIPLWENFLLGCCSFCFTFRRRCVGVV